MQPDGFVVFEESRSAHVWAPFRGGHRLLAGGEAGHGELIVPNLDAMLDQLREAGVDVVEKVEDMEGVGRFGWAVDPEGNRFELWEPADQ